MVGGSRSSRRSERRSPRQTRRVLAAHRSLSAPEVRRRREACPRCRAPRGWSRQRRMGRRRTRAPVDGTPCVIRDSSATAAPPSENIVLPLACTALWTAAAASARLLGIWTAIGATAIVLGIAVFALDGPAARKLLRPLPRLVLLGAGVGGAMAAATYALYPLFSG